MMKVKLLLLILTMVSCNRLMKYPQRLNMEIKRFSDLSVPDDKKPIVFTGSSSIRMWENLDQDCNEMQIINTGFGGSQMSDLLYFLDQAVLRFQPVEVYIYEGDNDIATKKKPEDILETAKKIVNEILDSNSDTKINFIGAKPCPLRWRYKDKYEEFNSLLKAYCDSHNQLFYIDVWNAMLNENGRPSPDIFISDSLHMNRKGYLLWKEIICKNSE